MRLEDIAASFDVDPEREKQFAKEMCSNLRGRVRNSIGMQAGTACMLLIVAGRLIALCAQRPGLGSMLLLIIALFGGALVLWYVVTWELTFDGETGFFSYHTLLKGTMQFHVSEIVDFSTTSSQYRRKRRDHRVERLTITVGDTKIRIITRSESNGILLHSMSGANTDGEKLKQYLELYQKCIASPEDGLSMSGVDPRIAAAIAEAKKEEQTEVPGLEPMTHSEPEKTSASIPETADTSGLEPFGELPDDAALTKRPEQKQEVNVDALFDNVLSQYGKSSSPGRESSSSADLLFRSVFDKLK